MPEIHLTPAQQDAIALLTIKDLCQAETPPLGWSIRRSLQGPFSVTILTDPAQGASHENLYDAVKLAMIGAKLMRPS